MTKANTLRSHAAARGFTIGAGVGADTIRTDPEYARTLREEFNGVTTGSALKMGPLRPDRDSYDFDDADTIVEFGLEHEMTVRGHTLLWHNQQPEFLDDWAYTEDELREFVRDHIHTVVERYRGQIDAWDVVNEGIADDGTMRATRWYEDLGEEYIADAFRWAHEADPDADLYYNDYGADEVNEKSDAIYDLLERLLEAGVPIDGVGLQMHALGGKPDPQSVAENIRRFQELGLTVQITEMDVAFPLDDQPENPLAAQADFYRDIVDVCLDTGVDTLVVWGIDDGNSWVRYFRDFPDRFTGDPLLFDEQYRPKPAYDAVRDALASSEN